MFSAGFDAFGFARDTALAAALAASCVVPDSGKGRQITTRNTARDKDIIRSAFGERRLNYYGGSYGTYFRDGTLPDADIICRPDPGSLPDH